MHIDVYLSIKIYLNLDQSTYIYIYIYIETIVLEIRFWFFLPCVSLAPERTARPALVNST